MTNFAKITGHEKETQALSLDLESGKLSHAYLFSGPRNIGKNLVAREFAKAILCERSGCGECASCLLFEKGTHSDFTELLDDSKILSLETIKELLIKLNMTPQGKYKVFLLDNIERMNKESANAFLKILEEPPLRTIIIMTCSNSADILSTIISRARNVVFSAPNKDLVLKLLEEKYPETDRGELERIFELSLFRIGKCFEFLQNPEKYEDYIKMEEQLAPLLKEGNVVDRFQFVEKLVSDKDEKKERISVFLEVLTHLTRKRMISESTGVALNFANILSKISLAGILLKRNTNAKLLLENLMLII